MHQLPRTWYNANRTATYTQPPVNFQKRNSIVHHSPIYTILLTSLSLTTREKVLQPHATLYTAKNNRTAA